MERVYSRARALCEQVGEPSQLFRILWGLRVIYNQRGDSQAIQELEEQLLSLAQRLQAPDLLLGPTTPCGPACSMAASLLPPATWSRASGSMTRSGTSAHAALYSGHDPGVCCRMQAAPCLWLLGLPRPGTGQPPGSAGLGQAARAPMSLTPRPVLGCRAASPAPGGAPDQAYAEATMAIATDQGFPQPFAGNAPAGLGAGRQWARGEEGEAQIRRASSPTERRGPWYTVRITWPCSPRHPPRWDKALRDWRRWPRRWLR